MSYPRTASKPCTVKVPGSLGPGLVNVSVVAGGDVDDARVPRVAETVQRRVEQTQAMPGRLIGDRDDSRQQRARLAGPTHDVIARAFARESQVHERTTIDGGAQADVRRAA